MAKRVAALQAGIFCRNCAHPHTAQPQAQSPWGINTLTNKCMVMYLFPPPLFKTVRWLPPTKSKSECVYPSPL
eukprot:3978399-Prymnesium_polylepis.2